MCCDGNLCGNLIIFTVSICFLASQNGRIFVKSSVTMPGQCMSTSNTKPWYLHCIAECLELLDPPGSKNSSVKQTACYYDELTARLVEAPPPPEVYGECAAPTCAANLCPSQQNKTKNVKDVSATNHFANLFFVNKTKACGKYYLVTALPDTHSMMALRCCTTGMKILSIDSKAEYDCLTDTIRNELKRFGPFWTSGSSGSPCPGGFAWCSTGTVFDQGAVTWLPEEPSRKKGEDCVALNILKTTEKTGLVDELCSVRYKGICEGNKP